MYEQKFNHRVCVKHNGWTDRRNNLPMEGGALNAGYTPVDALCHISNVLGKHGLVYNQDWWWEGFGHDWKHGTESYLINLQFAKEEYKLLIPLKQTYESRDL
jgi:hypothetical protein